MDDDERFDCAQEVMVMPSGVVGAPMRFPFGEILDRDPQYKGTDIVLNDDDFHYMTRAIFYPRINNALLEQSN